MSIAPRWDIRLTVTVLCTAALVSCGEAKKPSVGDDRSTQVVTLDDVELQMLCAAFFAEVCSTDAFADECDAGCLDCTKAGVPAQTRVQCEGPITVGQVDDCAEAAAAESPGTFSLCSEGGGCVFDVGDLLCSTESCIGGVDDDLDGPVDCADPDCAADPACA